MSELIKFKHLVGRMPERAAPPRRWNRHRVREFKYAHIGPAQRTEVTLCPTIVTHDNSMPSGPLGQSPNGRSSGRSKYRIGELIRPPSLHGHRILIFGRRLDGTSSNAGFIMLVRGIISRTGSNLIVDAETRASLYSLYFFKHA